jgi:predicted secreted protein
MVASVGRALIVTKNNVVIAGLRTASISWGGESIDVTNGDNKGKRLLLAASGQEQVDLSVEGVMKAELFRSLVLGSATKMLTDIEIEWPLAVITNVSPATLSGNFRISAYEEGAPYNDSITFTATFESSGPFIYAPEAASANCAALIAALGSIDPDVDSDGIFDNFQTVFDVGLVWDSYKCVVAQNSEVVDGVIWPMVCTIDWAECNDVSSENFINAALDMRSGSEEYNTPFSFVFTNVPTDQYLCKAFVCGTRSGGSGGGLGSVTLPGDQISNLVNYGTGPLLIDKNRLRFFLVRNNGGVLSGFFFDF